MSRQPATLMALARNITRPFAMASAKAPTNGASITNEMTKKDLRSGVIQYGHLVWMSSEIAATRRALSASAEKNCAASIV